MGDITIAVAKVEREERKVMSTITANAWIITVAIITAGRAVKEKVETEAETTNVETTTEVERVEKAARRAALDARAARRVARRAALAEKAGRKDADTTPVTTDAAKATPKSKVERMSASLPIRSKGWRFWNRFKLQLLLRPKKKKKEESCVFSFDEQPVYDLCVYD